MRWTVPSMIGRPLRDFSLATVVVAAGADARQADWDCLAAFQKELDYIHRTLRRLGTPPSEVGDLAQDVFLAFRRRWSDYRPERPLRPYLFGITFRIASTHQRNVNRRREALIGTEIVELADTRAAADDAIQNQQARALVVAALDRVPQSRRAVLVMYDVDDVPMREIASALKIPLFTAYGRLRKAARARGRDSKAAEEEACPNGD